jgi:cobalt/nickel transport system permease protein
MHHFNQTKIHDCLLTRTDPRVKLLSALALLIMVLSSRGFVFPLLIATLCIMLCLSMGIRPKAVALRFVEPGMIISMIVLLKVFFAGHSALFSFGLFGMEITAYREGLVEGLLIAGRITGAVALVAALSFTTSLTDLMAAFAWLRVPQAFIEITLFAWRYLFLLSDDARVIYEAQKNRLGYSGYRRGVRSFGTLAGALVIKAFDNSRNVTTAMVQRGYDGSMPMLLHKPFRTAEVMLSLFLVAFFGIIWQTM